MSVHPDNNVSAKSNDLDVVRAVSRFHLVHVSFGGRCHGSAFIVYRHTTEMYLLAAMDAPWRARAAREYKGVWGQNPQQRSRGRAPGQGLGSEAHLKLFCSWTGNRVAKGAPFSLFCELFGDRSSENGKNSSAYCTTAVTRYSDLSALLLYVSVVISVVHTSFRYAVTKSVFFQSHDTLSLSKLLPKILMCAL